MIIVFLISLAVIACITYIVCFGWGAASITLVALAITISVTYAIVQIIKTFKNTKK